MHAEPRQRPRWARVLRTILWALALAFAFGFLVGSLLLRELERPLRYIGRHQDPGTAQPSDGLEHPWRPDPGESLAGSRDATELGGADPDRAPGAC
jgi:hypothetical protein